MKKWLYIAAAFFLGVVVASSAGTVSAQVKSLIGEKVTGEYTVIVNGKELQDKGAVISGKTNVPLRSLTDALGVGIQVSGKTINVTSEATSNTDKVVLVDGKYYTKYDLLNKKKSLEDSLSTLEETKKKEQAEVDSIVANGTLSDENVWKLMLESTLKTIDTKTVELEKVNEALKTFE